MMSQRKLFDVAWKYVNILEAHQEDRHSHCRLCYVKWMLSQMLAQDDYEVQVEDIGKFNRWLGFIQGVFWCDKVFTIDEMKEHNRSNNE